MYKGIYDIFKHYYHGGMIYFYSDPHFGDTEMNQARHITDEMQIKSINAKIGKCDTIIFLGDIGDKECLKKIRGYKVLVLGNHDPGATTFEGYVDEIYEGAVMLSEKILLTHEPVTFPYALNIHGHTHTTHQIDKLHFNVCAEAISYTPVPLKDIINAGILKDITTIHRETIDKQTKKKKARTARKHD